MASRSSNTERFAFPLASGLNKPGDKTVKVTIDIYLKNNLLRQGIYQFDLLGEKYMAFVAQLQVNWGYSIGIIKDKAMAKTPDKDDHAQSRVIAIQIRKVVQTYFANNPKAPQDPISTHATSTSLQPCLFTPSTRSSWIATESSLRTCSTKTWKKSTLMGRT
jgi:hypothetical protein